MPDGRVNRAARRDCGRIQAHWRAEQTVSGPEHEEHAKEARDSRPKARRPLVLAERGERGRGDPILQGRLLEGLVAVQARRDPVAAYDHLSRNLRVAAFVGLDEVPITEIAEPRKAECRKEREELGASEAFRRPGHSRRLPDEQSRGDPALFCEENVVGAASGLYV